MGRGQTGLVLLKPDQNGPASSNAAKSYVTNSPLKAQLLGQGFEKKILPKLENEADVFSDSAGYQPES
ncbi:hypothetical protein HW555_006531 [Spodoptera exigua]|uniref:Uncharacterized protein n=1 Tax=Spodoptera exigua TaxID=7107 RepID=A0A835GFY7_SPOEX|nr:hypothetical protein HW555_006531 [Spodoptera exigua]